jgi:two-component system, NarL family, nitrate/nitrite response regulator NarL
MKGLPPRTLPLRVAVQADNSLVDALAAHSDQMILSPVETSLEISARVTQADVMVIDISADPARSLETLRALTFKRPVLALVGPGQAFDAISAGARGAVPRDSSPSAIAAAILAVHNGLGVIAPYSLLGLKAPEAVTRSATNQTLTRRENEVLVLLADGLSNKEIAIKLSISEHTAKFHVNSILQKMNAQKRVEAVVRAAKLGLIHL